MKKWHIVGLVVGLIALPLMLASGLGCCCVFRIPIGETLGLCVRIKTRDGNGQEHETIMWRLD